MRKYATSATRLLLFIGTIITLSTVVSAATPQTKLKSGLANVWQPDCFPGCTGQTQKGEPPIWIPGPDQHRAHNIFTIRTPEGKYLGVDEAGCVMFATSDDRAHWQIEDRSVGTGFKLIRHVKTRGYLNKEAAAWPPASVGDEG